MLKCLLPLGLACLASLAGPSFAQEPPSTAAELIQAGRAQLAARQPDAALETFERAAALTGVDFQSRLWILRAWIDQGRNNDTLDALDALRDGGQVGPGMDYLYGMAFIRRAEGQIRQRMTDSSIKMNLLDATERLGRATSAQPDRFSDAFHPLAKAAYYTEQFDIAQAAAMRALELHPRAARSWLLLGRIAISQFRAAHELEAWSEQAEAHWSAALQAFQKAITHFGSPAHSIDEQRLLADAAIQLAQTHMWKQQRFAAARAYAKAMAWFPEAVDYPEVMDFLARVAAGPPGELFDQTLEDGARRFEETFGANDVRDTTLLWWLGWSRAEHGRHKAAATAFKRLLRKDPQVANAYYHLAMAQHASANFPGALTALRAGWENEPSVMLTEIQSDLASGIWKLEEMVQGFLKLDQFAACAFLAELCAEADPQEKRHWSNLGWFLRKHSDALIEQAELAQSQAPAPELLGSLHERSLAAYGRALELAPTDAAILNEAAVVLHYYLERDGARALEMYAQAIALAQESLADDSLSDDQRTLFRSVERDARKNIADLKQRNRLDQKRKKLARNPPL